MEEHPTQAQVTSVQRWGIHEPSGVPVRFYFLSWTMETGVLLDYDQEFLHDGKISHYHFLCNAGNHKHLRGLLECLRVFPHHLVGQACRGGFLRAQLGARCGEGLGVLPNLPRGESHPEREERQPGGQPPGWDGGRGARKRLVVPGPQPRAGPAEGPRSPSAALGACCRAPVGGALLGGSPGLCLGPSSPAERLCSVAAQPRPGVPTPLRPPRGAAGRVQQGGKSRWTVGTRVSTQSCISSCEMIRLNTNIIHVVTWASKWSISPAEEPSRIRA